MTRRRSPRRKTGAGRILGIAANTLLILIVLAFGLSIARRYGTDEGRAARVEPMRQVPPPEPPLDPALLRDRPTVDIRNGSGERGLAEQMMHRLRRTGFDVVEFRNADRSDYEKTLIRDRSGRAGAAAKLDEWMSREYGVGEVVEDRVSVPEADLVLVVGRDLADTIRVREARGR